MYQLKETTFKMLYQWYNDQEGDPSKFFFRALTTDAGFKQEQVFKLSFKEKQHTCTSSSGSSLNDFQLMEIAEELLVEKLIPFSLRLGLTYAKICSIREDSKNHSVDVRFKVMFQWKKRQTREIDQVETLARILEDCHERKKAYQIRQNHLGVTNEGKTLLISEEKPMKGVAEVQLNVTHSNQLVEEEAQGKLQALLYASSSQVSLVPSTGISADFLEGLNSFTELCMPHLDLVKNLERSIGRDGFYKPIGLTVDSIHFHVKVYTVEGLRWLQRDVQSGRIGYQLGKVLISENTKQQVQKEIVLDVAPEGTGAWDLLSHAVTDPILPSTRLSDFENREALKGDRTSSSDLMAQQRHPVVQAATVRKQVVTQEEGISDLLASSSPLATPGEIALVASHVSMRQDECGPDDAVDKEKDSVTSPGKAYSDDTGNNEGNDDQLTPLKHDSGSNRDDVSFGGLSAPPEILARGQRAQQAYAEVAQAGTKKVFRTRLMLVGQERVGKTSLKKSLTGNGFDPNEAVTDSVETRNACEICIEVAKVGEKMWSIHKKGHGNEDTKVHDRRRYGTRSGHLPGAMGLHLAHRTSPVTLNGRAAGPEHPYGRLVHFTRPFSRAPAEYGL
eukprot:XP_011683422.1 PREDICTED: uncharacterized protein LOC105447276 [Strongylocentrotus purpuratus]